VLEVVALRTLLREQPVSCPARPWDRRKRQSWPHRSPSGCCPSSCWSSVCLRLEPSIHRDRHSRKSRPATANSSTSSLFVEALLFLRYP
jgi:hypothetical protein